LVGDRCWIADYSLLQARQKISIGSDVLIGEFTSIRDSTHEYAISKEAPRNQGDRLGWIVIQDGAWIGRGCLIQGHPDGLTIGSGAIVGANSVVTKSIPPREVWGGVPAAFIKKRVN
jgi:acetyltransferase-like isoleucine patch superfamily enzyme